MVAHCRLTPKQELKACSLYADEHASRSSVCVWALPGGLRKILIWNNVARKTLGVKMKATTATGKRD